MQSFSKSLPLVRTCQSCISHYPLNTFRGMSCQLLELTPPAQALVFLPCHLLVSTSYRVSREFRPWSSLWLLGSSSVSLLPPQCPWGPFIISNPFSLFLSKLRCLHGHSHLLTEGQGYKSGCLGDSLWLIDINSPPSILPSIVKACRFHFCCGKRVQNSTCGHQSLHKCQRLGTWCDCQGTVGVETGFVTIYADSQGPSLCTSLLTWGYRSRSNGLF